MEHETKKLDERVTVTRETGLLRVTIKPESGLSGAINLRVPVVALAIAAVILPQTGLFSRLGESAAFYLNIAVVAAFLIYLIGRILRQAQIIEVFQGVLRIKDQGFVWASERRYDISGISSPGLNIPPGKNHPGHIKIPKGPRIPKPSLSFFYGTERELVNFAPGLERLPASYILELLKTQGLK